MQSRLAIRVYAYVSAAVVCAVVAGPASAQFTDCDLDRIRKWADNGAKND